MYSELQIMLFAGIISIFLVLNVLRKKRFSLPVIILYILYIVDSLIIMLTEQSPLFAEWYNHSFINTPIIKTFIFLGYAMCMMMIWNSFMRSSFSMMQAVLLIIFGLWLIIVPFTGHDPIHMWLYFEGWSIFAIMLCIYGLFRLRTLKHAGAGMSNSRIRIILVATIIFSLAIMIEDAYVIFNIDNYSVADLSIQSRSFSEDMLRIFYSVFCIIQFVNQFSSSCINVSDNFFLLSEEKDRKKISEKNVPEKNAAVGNAAVGNAAGGKASDGNPPDDNTSGGNAPDENASEWNIPRAGNASEENAPGIIAPDNITATGKAPVPEINLKLIRFGKYYNLTERELQVLDEVLTGKNNASISETLSVSIGTIKAHVHNILFKTDVGKRSELVSLYDEFE